MLCGVDGFGNGDYTAVGIQAIADALRVNTSLKSLDLSSNKIGQVGGEALAKALIVIVRGSKGLCFGTSLTDLNLGYNSIGPEGGVALADALCINASLKSLDLDNNSLGPGGGVALADALRVNTSLTDLNLRSNLIGPEGGVALADALRVNDSLTEVRSSFPATFGTHSIPACTVCTAVKPLWKRAVWHPIW